MQCDVVIIGGGLAGAALAVALRKSSLSVALVEGRAPVRPDGWDARIYAISPANARFLADIGLWSHLDARRMQAVAQMDIRGDDTGQLQFSAYDSGVSELAWICESSLIHCELWESARRQANLTLCCPGRPQSLHFTDESAVLTLDDETTLECRLIVGADGADSWTRTKAGIPVASRPYDQLGVVANFETELPHEGKALQWFRGDDVLAWLPLPGNRISMVWSIGTAAGRSLMAKEAGEFVRDVQNAGNNALGKLTLMAPPSGFPLRLMRAARTVQPRVALIGDAAHAIHPLSGHGINLGFQDAASLASLLLDKPAHVDCGSLSLLRVHERRRKEEVIALQTVTDTLHRLFREPRDPVSPIPALRNIGMSLTNQLPVIKDALVRYALAS